MNVPVCLADYMTASQFLHQTGNFQTALKIRSNADKAKIKIGDSQAFQHIFIGTVTNFRTDHIRKHFFQIFFFLIYNHHLIAQLRQIFAEMASKTPHSYNQN